jgi:hypothetical protein
VATGAALGASAAASGEAATVQASNAASYSAGEAAGAAAATSSAVYTTLPANCQYKDVGGNNYFLCGGTTWMSAAYGANGLYYKVVPAP